MILTVLQDHYKFKAQLQQELKEKGLFVDSCEVHEGKMICNLVQCSKWNRKHHPFLLCKCKRGDAVKNFSTYKCDMITDEDQVNLFEKSATKV